MTSRGPNLRTLYKNTWEVWHAMRQRCLNSKNKRYDFYGGRGITVCARWASFSSFIEDMGTPKAGYTLDRINNDGNYEPNNCRWVTHKQQNRNYSRNKLFSFNGETLCLRDWEIKLGLSVGALHHRLRAGWPVEIALTKPNQSHRSNQ